MRKEQATQAQKPRSPPGTSGPGLGCQPRVLGRGPPGGLFCGGLLASPFFAKPIQNGFCGIGFLARETAGPCAALFHCRWVYEKGALLRGGCPGHPGHLSAAAFAGRSVPFHTSPPSRGALRSAGVPTIAASTTPAPRPPQGARHLGRLCRRKGIPRVRRGVGYVGAWRFARPSQSHRGYLPVGEASGQNLPVGPPLGALRRCLRGAIAPRSRLPTALWGIQEGKADVTRGETGERRTSSAATRAPVPADPVT
jgi:hypothetical protein